MKKIIGFAAILLVILSGCASFQVATLTPATKFRIIPAPVRQKALSYLRFWANKGVFGIQREADNTDRSVIANYVWRDSNKVQFRIAISSTFNLYNMIITGRLGQVTLWTNSKNFYTASSPERLMNRVLGWSLPISDLRYWIKGMVAPGRHQAQYDEFGLLRVLYQDGWTITYDQFAHVDGYTLPIAFTLDRPGTSVKIVIKDWSLMMQPAAMAG